VTTSTQVKEQHKANRQAAKKGKQGVVQKVATRQIRTGYNNMLSSISNFFTFYKVLDSMLSLSLSLSLSIYLLHPA
jgi:membrane protein insertase Oxa1/YidC/SpoIIIJ